MAKNGRLDISCAYDEKNGGKVAASINRNGIYAGDLYLKNEILARVFGNFKTGEFNIELPETEVSKIPFAKAIGESPSGTVEASGSIDEHSGKIKFSLRKFKAKNIKETDIFGLVARQGSMYVVNFYKSDNSVIFNAVTEKMQLLSADFKFTEVESSAVLQLFGIERDLISGISSGRIVYEKDGNMEFDVKAYDGKIKGKPFKKLELKGDATDERVNVKNIIYKSGRETNLYASGLIGFTKDNPQSHFNIRVRNFDISGILFDGDLFFNGDLDSKGRVGGKFGSRNFKVSKVPFKNLSGEVLISRHSFEIPSLRAENGLEAEFYSDFSGNFKGLLELKNTNIKNAVSGLSGLLASSVKFSGGSDGIKASAGISLTQASYLNIPFSASSKVSFSNGVFTLSDALIISEQTKVWADGEIGGNEKLKIGVENVTESVINKFVGFRTPVKGSFSGSGEFVLDKGKPAFNMALTAPVAYIKNLKLNAIKADVVVLGSNIRLIGASAKIADSEIRVDGGNFDAESGQYALDLFLVNAHAGPTDMFGKIELFGAMDKKKGGSVYSGKLTMSNFWINRYKLSDYSFDYVIQDKKLSVSQKDFGQNDLNISGIIDFSEAFAVKDFAISKKGSFLNLTAELKDNLIDIDANGQFLDGAFISEILDLPVDLYGSVFLTLKCYGDMSSPEAEIAVAASSGSVAGIPYDSIEAEISALQNEALAKISMRKKNEISVSINGTFPFWIDSSLTEYMRKKPVSFKYEIEDNKLSLIKYFTGDFFKPRGGKLSFSGEISGTFSQIRNSGSLTVSGGSFDSKYYFERMKDVNADIAIRDNFITINKFSAKTTPGKLNISGGIKLENFLPSYLDLRFYSDNKGISISVPDLPITSFLLAKNILNDISKGEPKFDIYLRGEPSRPKISGQVILENTRFSFPPPEDDTDFPLPQDTEFDIELITGKNTKYENSFINAWINGRLNIRGKYGHIKAPGVIDTQRGTINYLGINFEIVSAKLEVTDNNQVFLSG
ncbi:MAG: translocation/assembly module TamB domain-containing protein, partial [Endomicrobium sp.]|nr:translocation/assembly module TamB domain-containing protein [Endomicrobium sp.]